MSNILIMGNTSLIPETDFQNQVRANNKTKIILSLSINNKRNKSIEGSPFNVNLFKTFSSVRQN